MTKRTTRWAMSCWVCLGVLLMACGDEPTTLDAPRTQTQALERATGVEVTRIEVDPRRAWVDSLREGGALSLPGPERHATLERPAFAPQERWVDAIQRDFTVVVTEADGARLEGVEVALDLTNGWRMEATTSKVFGEARFTLLPGERPELVTVGAPGYVIRTTPAPQGDMSHGAFTWMVLERNAPAADWVRVMGKARHTGSPLNLVRVTTSAPGTTQASVSTALDLRVAPETPFTLVGTLSDTWSGRADVSARGWSEDFLGWTLMELPALPAGATMGAVDLDFATSDPSVTTEGWFEVPDWMDGDTAREARAYAQVTSAAQPTMFLGGPTWLDATAGAFAYDLEWVTTKALAPELMTRFTVWTPDGTFTRVDQAGVPHEGYQELNFLRPPVVFRDGAHLLEPLRWLVGDAALDDTEHRDVRAWLVDADGKVLWEASSHPAFAAVVTGLTTEGLASGATRFAELPSALSATEVLGEGTFELVVADCATHDPLGQSCERAAGVRLPVDVPLYDVEVYQPDIGSTAPARTTDADVELGGSCSGDACATYACVDDATCGDGMSCVSGYCMFTDPTTGDFPGDPGPWPEP